MSVGLGLCDSNCERVSERETVAVGMKVSVGLRLCDSNCERVPERETVVV